MNYFVGILSVWMHFLLNVVIVWVNRKFWVLLMRLRVVKSEFFYFIRVFMWKSVDEA